MMPCVVKGKLVPFTMSAWYYGFYHETKLLLLESNQDSFFVDSTLP